jgi:hypothetical protein
MAAAARVCGARGGYEFYYADSAWALRGVFGEQRGENRERDQRTEIREQRSVADGLSWVTDSCALHRSQCRGVSPIAGSEPAASKEEAGTERGEENGLASI